MAVSDINEAFQRFTLATGRTDMHIMIFAKKNFQALIVAEPSIPDVVTAFLVAAPSAPDIPIVAVESPTAQLMTEFHILESDGEELVPDPVQPYMLSPSEARQAMQERRVTASVQQCSEVRKSGSPGMARDSSSQEILVPPSSAGLASVQQCSEVLQPSSSAGARLTESGIAGSSSQGISMPPSSAASPEVLESGSSGVAPQTKSGIAESTSPDCEVWQLGVTSWTKEGAPQICEVPWASNPAVMKSTWLEQLNRLKSNNLPIGYREELDCVMVGYDAFFRYFAPSMLLTSVLDTAVRTSARDALRNLSAYATTSSWIRPHRRIPMARAAYEFLQKAQDGVLVVPVVVSWAPALVCTGCVDVDVVHFAQRMQKINLQKVVALIFASCPFYSQAVAHGAVTYFHGDANSGYTWVRLAPKTFASDVCMLLILLTHW